MQDGRWEKDIFVLQNLSRQILLYPQILLLSSFFSLQLCNLNSSNGKAFFCLISKLAWMLFFLCYTNRFKHDGSRGCMLQNASAQTIVGQRRISTFLFLDWMYLISWFPWFMTHEDSVKEINVPLILVVICQTSRAYMTSERACVHQGKHMDTISDLSILFMELSTIPDSLAECMFNKMSLNKFFASLKHEIYGSKLKFSSQKLEQNKMIRLHSPFTSLWSFWRSTK